MKRLLAMVLLFVLAFQPLGLTAFAAEAQNEKSVTDLPWNNTTLLTGTTWSCTEPHSMTLRFLKNGVFEVDEMGETATGEYHWESYDTLGLTLFGSTIYFVSKADPVRFEIENGDYTFYLSKTAAENSGFNAEAFAAELEADNLSLKKVKLPGTEDIGNVKWLSVSPNGRCLLGAYSEGYGVYYVAEEVFIPLAYDTTGDEYGNLERFSKSALPKYLSIVWSPDERYFAVVNRDEVTAGHFKWDLFVGDLTTNTFRVLQTWSNKLTNGGAVYQACFDQSSEKIYYSFYGKVDNPFGSDYFTVEYDIATGESRPLFSNEWANEYGDKYRCYYDGMHCLSDGRILQIAACSDREDHGISIMTPTGDGWERKFLSVLFKE